MNHWKRTELKNLYHGEMLELKGKLKVAKYPVIIVYDFHFVKKPLDSLNCAMMAKMVEDGMVHAEVLEDDSADFVKESCLKTQKSKQFKNDTVLITILEP